MTEILKHPLKVIDAEPSLLGEGPVWDARRHCICWVDILNGHIHEYTPAQNTYRKIQVNDMLGAIALRADGNFIAALKSGLAFVNRDTGAVRMLDHPELHLPGNRFNDGKCDPAGRFWVGTMALSEEPGAGSLYMIDKDLSHVRKIEDVTISNGLAWSPDYKTLYYIDTPTMAVVAYDYDIHTGDIANKRTAITIPENQGFPDGMTIDRDGHLWIAHWDGWQVTRWDPRTGMQLLSIPLPVARVTSCTFGGADFQDLYITTAKVDLTAEQLAAQPLAGRLFVVEDCGYGGVEAWAFGYEGS